MQNRRKGIDTVVCTNRNNTVYTAAHVHKCHIEHIARLCMLYINFASDEYIAAIERIHVLPRMINFSNFERQCVLHFFR